MLTVYDSLHSYLLVKLVMYVHAGTALLNPQRGCPCHQGTGEGDAAQPEVGPAGALGPFGESQCHQHCPPALPPLQRIAVAFRPNRPEDNCCQKELHAEERN